VAEGWRRYRKAYKLNKFGNFILLRHLLGPRCPARSLLSSKHGLIGARATLSRRGMLL
jgi:hypothetical protein